MKSSTPKPAAVPQPSAEELKTIALQIKVDSAALLEKYKDQNLEIKPGDNGKLKVIATFQRGKTGFRFMKQVKPTDLGTVAADLDAAIAREPGPRKAQKGAGGTRSPKAQAILDELKKQKGS